MHADLEALLRLQEKDKVVLDIRAEIKAVEPEVAALDEALAETEGQLATARERATEADNRRAELDLARTVLAREEAEWVKSADRVQDAKGYVEECEEVVGELKTEQAPKREELAARLAELDDRLKAAQADRAKVAEGVAQALQDRYERILRGRAPLALYAVRAGACGHCFTAVPLYRLQKLRNGDTLETCEACGVLLYDEGE